ncbi:hypothetical protein [Magnetospirillum sp. SS-4]|uniref:hypothetical protein n=1 Tax=Magnetospirillum sp. SS-4 TaxID=2681465 RepID=UPI00137FC706|nr:hypothetical protein [Magnetospirillum sp. SS-4]CAA7617974.1 conserved exported hypothetical protein [Magnetospirillum sp. SS-4]
MRPAMISSVSLSSLVSGLGVQSRVVETAAANIANATTGDYESARGQVVSRPLQGAAYVPLPPEGEVDLGREVVNLALAKHSYTAMARAYSSIAETEKRGLDALA